MKRKALSALLILLITVPALFAASAQDLYEDFQAAVTAGSVQEAVDAYGNMQDKVAKEMEDLQDDLDKAIQKNDRQLYANTRADMRELSSYRLSKADTDALLTAIVNSGSDQAAQWAKWLYENSAYYHPVLTLTTSVSGEGYSRSYTRSVSVAPGNEVTLPTNEQLGGNASVAGVLTGWGITPDEVLYAPGETITMPYTDQTLYAIYSSQVSFTDSYTNDSKTFSDVADGDVIEVPAPASLEGAIFEGWYDPTSGQYLSPEDTEYTVRGMGAAFQALYIKAEASELNCGYYDITSIPVSTQVPLTFTLSNSGTEDLYDVDIKVSSDSEQVTLMNTSAHLRTMRAGEDYVLRGTKLVVSSDCASGTQLPITVTMTDGDGNSFTSTFTLTVK